MNSPAIRFYDTHPKTENIMDEVVKGLSSNPKSLPPKLFYDRLGSELFESICVQPEYYPTRTEMSILRSCGKELSELLGPESVIIELGSGASQKIRVLVDQIKPRAYVGIDISREFLIDSTQALASDFPDVHVSAFCADLSAPLALGDLPKGRRVAFYPGSSIGNFEPEEAVRFLKDLKPVLGDGGGILIGVDRKKDARVLNEAYNDRAGVTARFNKNMLYRLRREMNVNVNPGNFEHKAFYNSELGRIEMHLESLVPQIVRVGDNMISFERGERIHTENSYKYSVAEFKNLALRSGFNPVKVWTDPASLFSVYYLQVD